MKHHNKQTGVTCILCPKLLAKEKKKAKKQEEAQRRADIARIEAEERALLPKAVSSEIVVPEYSEFYQEKINYWNGPQFEPALPPMHAPFSTHCH
tara:strand:- start:266 stop:550 length:285 start_codon:yes stop_codon:yes gene_type:complete